MQYQQLKQVPPPICLLLLSFPSNCLCPSIPFASASCLTARCCAGTSCRRPCPFCVLLLLCLHLTLLLLLPLHLLVPLLLPFHLPLPIVLPPFHLPLPFASCTFSSCPSTLALCAAHAFLYWRSQPRSDSMSQWQSQPHSFPRVPPCICLTFANYWSNGHGWLQDLKSQTNECILQDIAS